MAGERNRLQFLHGHRLRALAPAAVILSFACFAYGQSVAVLAPEPGQESAEFAANLGTRLQGRFRVLDEPLARSAFMSSPPANPFNMTVEEASRIGAVVGSDAVILVRAGSPRRSSSERPEYYETYASVYAFGARTGTLLYWELHKSEASTPAAAKRGFAERLGSIAARVESEIKAALKAEISATQPPPFADAAAESEQRKDFRPPVPYKRLKPQYTDVASLYDVRATVDVMIYLDEKGEIVRADVARWAGFGLDESVLSNIRSMNWRPAYAGTKPVATKFLVRYNFKKGE